MSHVILRQRQTVYSIKYYLPPNKIFIRIMAWGFKKYFGISINILKEKSFYGEQKFFVQPKEHIQQNSLFSQKNTSKKTKDTYNLPR